MLEDTNIKIIFFYVLNLNFELYESKKAMHIFYDLNKMPSSELYNIYSKLYLYLIKIKTGSKNSFSFAFSF